MNSGFLTIAISFSTSLAFLLNNPQTTFDFFFSIFIFLGASFRSSCLLCFLVASILFSSFNFCIISSNLSCFFCILSSFFA